MALHSYKEEIKAGILVILSLVILSVSIILIGGSSLTRTYKIYYMKMSNVAGIEVSSQVRLGGVIVGKVLAITPPDKAGEAVVVKMGLNEGTKVYEGMKAGISQIGFVGDIFVQIELEGATATLLAENSFIPSVERVQLDTLIAKMSDISLTMDKLLKDVDMVFSQKNVDQVGKVLEAAEMTAVNATKDFKRISQAMIDTSLKLQKVLDHMEDVFESNSEDVQRIMKLTQKDLNEAGKLMKTFQETAVAVKKTSETMDVSLSNQTKNVDALLGTINEATRELHELLQQIQHKPWMFIYKENEDNEKRRGSGTR